MHTEQKKQSTKKLSVYELFQILQIEWIVADLRARIYPNDIKPYWNRVKEGKKKRINDIAEKNSLPTIFTDEEMKRILEKKVYQPQGIPVFRYTDIEHEKMQQPLDLIYYYSKDATVRFEEFGIQKVGKIKSFVPPNDYCMVEYEDKTQKMLLSEVTRIL